MIPVCDADVPYLGRTIKSVRDNAARRVNVIVVFDGAKPVDVDADTVLVYPQRRGIRVAMNDVAQSCRGYLVKLDAHCSLSQGWDVRMRKSCKADTLVTAVVDTLDTETWTGKGQLKYFVSLDGNLRTQWIRSYRPKTIEEDTLAMIGECWMIRTDYYRRLGGCDESLGMWGALGPEWSLKVWLTGGRMVLRSDVICAHLFRSKTPFKVNIRQKNYAFRKLCNDWIAGADKRRTRTAGWLVDKFAYIQPLAFADEELQTPVFGVGSGYAIRSDDRSLLEQFVKDHLVKTVLEFGSGKSTFLFDRIVGGGVVSYETMKSYRDAIQSLVSDTCQVRVWDGYDCDLNGETFDLVFIDGPKGGVSREQAYRIAADTKPRYIACHDINRRWEQQWIREYLDKDYRLLKTNGTTGIYGRLLQTA